MTNRSGSYERGGSDHLQGTEEEERNEEAKEQNNTQRKTTNKQKTRQRQTEAAKMKQEQGGGTEGTSRATADNQRFGQQACEEIDAGSYQNRQNYTRDLEPSYGQYPTAQIFPQMSQQRQSPQEFPTQGKGERSLTSGLPNLPRRC